MRSLIASSLRRGIFLLFCAVLGGCAVDMGTYPQAQSMEIAVQAVLAKQGYYRGPIDGTVGPATSRAISNYQRDHHLTPTGTINPALVESLGLVGRTGAVPAYYYAGYPGYFPWYAPAYYASPVVIGVGWGSGWPGYYGGCWNRGWRGGCGRWGSGGNYGRCWR